MCPISADTAELLRSGLGHAKRKEIKNKTLRGPDKFVFRGVRDSDLGRVFCYPPGPVPAGLSVRATRFLDFAVEVRRAAYERGLLQNGA
ncbi:hypothetical protein [Nocardia carnea]|uniref:hypothetical protein n=1 Tax=Nocardia carnea TaxID=37328 RepID=UPI002455650B|nr:hypothetical protein [Nocardia carnea]